jgi:bifunctional non-homologous end joining protein LigD
MSLDLYKNKRKFNQTPEPASGTRGKKSPLTFVVQRHDARRLHYDLRLELDGVLKSWAIPRGPSMTAGEKRLAIMVEDHPLSYGDFYGEIPKGNYGAGMVEVWDTGTYHPVDEAIHAEKEFKSQLDKGSLKFRLNGTRLKGIFALVRIKDSEKNEWLLIKKDDEFSKSRYDIEKIKPLKSKPATGSKSKSSISKTDDFPSIAPRPMLAKPGKQVVDRPSWMYEIKYDGYRIIGMVKDGRAELITRNGHKYTRQYNTIADELNKVKDVVILDGEMVIENERGLSDFQLLQNYNTTRAGELKYYVFDMLYLNGQTITGLPLASRKELLELFFRKYNLKYIFNSNYQIGNGKELFDELSSKGYEGIIAKNPESVYLPGKRTDAWIKFKANMMQEAVICGFTMPGNNRRYFGSLILGLYENGILKYIGNCGTGFNDITLRELYDEFQKIRINESPINPIPKFTYTKGSPVWVRPEMVCSVKFTEWSRDGHMRHPVYMGVRADIDANDVVLEDPVTMHFQQSRENHDKSSKAGKASKSGKTGKTGKKTGRTDKTEKSAETVTESGNNEKLSGEKNITIAGKKVKLTNAGKIYWPDDGYTKGDLISYYRSISKLIVPYLKGRPQSLNRHPNGITGKSFYHKNMNTDQLPDWVKTEKLYSKSNDAPIDYLICNDAATLVFMANLGCIEINPWHSTYKDPDKPTYMMLDLDPGNIAFAEVVNTALVIKEICDEIKINCYCKTSGATGLHIYIPLAARYNYDQVKAFAGIMAIITHSRLPEVTSIERSTVKRKNKIYVDFLQNRKGQTIAAPYSVRPRPMATVSAPLEWKEVNAGLSPDQFTIKTIIDRLEKTGDIWQPVLKKGISLDKALKAIERL